MTVTQDELGRRLRAAREATGLTQDEVARSVGLPRPAIALIESGRRSVSSLELDALARAFRRDVRDLLAPSFQEKDPVLALFRATRAPQSVRGSGPALSARAREAVDRTVAIGRAITDLEELLDVRRERIVGAGYAPSRPASLGEAIQQGDAVARSERQRLCLGQSPIEHVTDLLESQGVRTGAAPLPDGVSGLTTFDPLLVIVNVAHHRLRRRFSFTHEYAHVLLDRERGPGVSSESDREALLEVRANTFAASFLMPEDGVASFLESLGKGRASRSQTEVFDGASSVRAETRSTPGSQAIQLHDVVLLAHHFGVSRTSALYRLKNLKALSPETFDDLKKADDKGAGAALAGSLGLEEGDARHQRERLPQRYWALALEAYRRGEITRSKLRELAGLLAPSSSPSAVERLLRQAKLDPLDEPDAPLLPRR